MSEEPHEQIDTDIGDSNPNAAGPEGLSGDMGISSERTGPEGDNPADTGVQGTGSHGSAAEGTEGVSNTSRADTADEPGGPGGSAPGAPATGGPEMDEQQQQATQEWRDEQPPAGEEDEQTPAGEEERRTPDERSSAPGTGIDRTVGEENTAEVPSQEFDPTKNPGHSHG